MKNLEKITNADFEDQFSQSTLEYLDPSAKADKVKVTEKEKNTFKNTTEDASHSAFASRCEFYITNDDKKLPQNKSTISKIKHLYNCVKTE